MDTAARLKALRKENGFTRQEFATECNIPYSTLTNYENGTRTPPYTFLLTAAKLFGVTIDYLLCATNDPNPAPWENGLKLAGQCLKVEPGRLRELAEADREVRLFLLPLEPGRSMFCHFERPWVMKNVAPCVQYQSSVGIVFYMGYDVFRGLVEHGKITPLSPEGEKALEAMKDE